ncbi:Alpha/Beta hydrolase protein [Mycena capillaripes]|nr:Alpha/Beta hydrolase protein [Mycena capillaripes]
MAPSASRCLAYLLLVLPPLVVSLYLLASFPTPPGPLPAQSYPGLTSLPPESRAREIYSEEWLEGGEGAYVDLPMGCTRYWLAGPAGGKKIVLVHGLSVPAVVWEPLVAPLVATGHRVLVYDLYGRGYSAAPVAVPYDAQLYVTQLALLLQHVGWTRTRLAGVSMGGAIAAAFVASFPGLVERDVVLVACAGLVESSDLPRTAKVMSSPLVQTLTANPWIAAYLRRLASKASAVPPATPQGDSPPSDNIDPSPPHLRELVRLQSAHLPGFNRAISSSLRAGPVRGMRWAFESEAWSGRRVLLVHGTADSTVPPAHANRIAALIEAAGRNASNSGEPTPTPNPNPNSKGKWNLKKSKPKHGVPSSTGDIQVSLIAGAGHALTWTHAREVGEVICRFLAVAG